MPVKPINRRAEVRDIKRRKKKIAVKKGLAKARTTPKYGKKKRRSY